MRAFCLIALAACASVAKADPVEVSNFRSGLACTNSAAVDGEPGWICQPTELILITDQGKCVYDHQEKPCTWMGFEFDYRASAKGAKLQCTSTNSQPVSEGNYEGVRSEDSTQDSYEIELPEKEGHFINLQYFIFNVSYPEDEDVVVNTTCASDGHKVFSFRFQIHFPVVPNPESGE